MGPTGQDLLPPLARAEEREESGTERNGPLQGRVSSPINRERQGDKYKPIDKVNGDL